MEEGLPQTKNYTFRGKNPILTLQGLNSTIKYLEIKLETFSFITVGIKVFHKSGPRLIIRRTRHSVGKQTGNRGI